MAGKYKAIKVNGVKHDYHRWLMEQTIGKKLESSELVHHIDEDKTNNSIDNLTLMSRAEHSRLHRVGKPLSDETKRKLSESQIGKPNRAQRKLTNEQVEYVRSNYIPRDKDFGARALAKRFDVKHSGISKIINNKSYKTPL